MSIVSSEPMSFQEKLNYINSLEKREDRINFMQEDINKKNNISQKDLDTDIEEWIKFGEKLEYLNSLKTREERINYMKQDIMNNK